MEDEEKMRELYEAMKRHPSAQQEDDESQYTELEGAIIRAVNLYRKVVSK